MSISENTIQKIKDSTDIVEVIGDVVELRKRGANFLGLCPFHTEKTPSFTVSADKGIYKCFGCGASGNAISFMMNHHGLNFTEAVKELARRAGIPIIEHSSKKEKEELSRREITLNILESATSYYFRMLGSTAGKIALSYFKKRGFNNDTIKEFRLGYSPDSWDSAIIEMKRQGYFESALDDSGLIVRNEESKSFYDRFRGRAMFPIQNISGKVIAFGARILKDEDNKPKYLNTPQTIVYDKSSTLYGFYQGKNEIRNKKTVLLAEGYADVISLHQAGFKHSVATCGTALTLQQLKLISKYCNKLYIVYDSDSAGINAAEKAIDIALPFGFDVFVVRLPEGDDPDSIIQSAGASTFQMYLDKALLFIDFKIERLKKAKMLDTPSARAESVRSVIKMISSVPDRLQHDFLLSRLASLLNITEYQLRKIYTEKQKIERNESKSHSEMPLVQSLQSAEEQNKLIVEEKSAQYYSSLLPEEKHLLKLAVSDKDALKKMFNNFKIKAEDFHSKAGIELFSLLTELSKSGENLSELIILSEEINAQDKDFLIRLSLDDLKTEIDWEIMNTTPEKLLEKNIKESFFRLIQKKIEIEINDLKKNIKITPLDEQREILMKITELTIKKNKYGI